MASTFVTSFGSPPGSETNATLLPFTVGVMSESGKQRTTGMKFMSHVNKIGVTNFQHSHGVPRSLREVVRAQSDARKWHPSYHHTQRDHQEHLEQPGREL